MQLNTFIEMIKKPSDIIYKIIYKYPHLIRDDRKYLEFIWKHRMGYPLNLDNPKSFNEKLQWLKLYNRNSCYITLVDKYEVKKFVSSVLGEEYIVPTLGLWDNFDDIDFNMLPNQFVLKCTHDSGGIVICKDKSKLNKKIARQTIERSLRRKYWLYGREWPYKDVKPRIIAEALLSNGNEDLKDYKFFCFSDKVEFFKIDFDREIEHHANYYGRDGLLKPFGEMACPPVPTKQLDIPNNMDFMIELAEKLSKSVDSPFLRIDLYNIKGKVFFGEITFFPASGMGVLTSMDWDYSLGNYIKLPSK